MSQSHALRAFAAAGLALCLAGTSAGAAEQQPQPAQPQPQQQTNPAGGGANWSTEVQPSPTPEAPAADTAETPETSQFDPEAVAQIGKINAYFNNIIHLEGRFTQIDPNNDRTNGRFYVQRPRQAALRLCAAEQDAHRFRWHST